MNIEITNNEVQNKVKKPKKIVWVSLAVFILITLSVAAQLTYAVLKHDRMYKGITVNGIDAGGLTEVELETLLKSNYEDASNNLKIILKAKDASEEFYYPDIDVSYNIKDAVDKAYSIGRNGNVFSRLKELFEIRKNGMDIALNISFDKQKLDDIVKKIYDRTFIQVKEATLVFEGHGAKLISGSHGESVDTSNVSAEVEKLIESTKEGTIELPIIITQPEKIDIDSIYSQINLEPVNAFAKVENNIAKVVPHVMGRQIDRSHLESAIAELEGNEGASRDLLVSLITPEITADKAQSLLFKDVLATKSTRFSTSTVNDANRGENIKLAASIINGKILAPGEVFSFNDVVGKRSSASGFKVAHIYSGGKVIDGIGGGICQVSSTLYNSVLYSDLEVVERRNHSFTVGYVPKGVDATVSYGSVDFKFKNSTSWPIKIQAKVNETNDIIFTLIGTNQTPGKKIEIVSETVKTTPYTIKYIDDPSLPEGTTRVRQSGKEGYTVNTYKVTKQDGKEISRVKLHTSVYRPLEKEVLRGTKKVAPSAPVTPQEPNKPSEPSQTPGTDDTAKPPAEGTESQNNPEITDFENVEEIAE